MGNKYFSLLYWLSACEKGASRPRLIRLCKSEELIDECIELGFIEEFRRNDYNESVYIITEIGKNKID